MTKRLLVASLLILFCKLHFARAAHSDRPPSILLVTCDNLGYGDLQMYNSKSEIRTPNLDRLAAQGARLTAFYTASPTCTVSRACLLTGRVPQRHGLENQLPGVKGNYGVGLSHREALLPKFLKLAPTPYVTGCFGKWNIGFAPGSRPTDRGFDEFIGHASGNMDYFHHNYRERHDLYNGIDELHRDGEYATDIFADAAVDFIGRHGKSNRPWFCYLPFNAPHFPTAGNKRDGQPNVWQAPDDAFTAIGLSLDESDPRKRYAAVVYALDRAIGRVLQSLDDTGQTDSTFVFFMSDNGAFRLGRKGLDVGINDPLRSGGVTCWEGGIRVPAMARWPGRIKAGSVIPSPFWSPDLLQACVKISGAELPDDVVFDGKDPMPLLCEGAPSPHRSLYFQFRTHTALRMGDWKIVREQSEHAWQLFNLKDDPSESMDLASTKSQRVKHLQSELNRWETSFSETAPQPPSRKLWRGSILPKTSEAEVLKGVQFHIIKKHEPEVDGYGFLHGVAVAWHNGKLYASFGHNKGSENTLTEEGRFCVSEDGGKTWSSVQTIDVGRETKDLAVSHGVFLSHEKLWAFLGSFYGTRNRVHTRAYTLNEENGEWQSHGTVVADGFWPMTEPVKMENGNWIMPGFIVGNGNSAAVAISAGDNLKKWKTVVIPRSTGLGKTWGESTVVVDGARVTNIARYGAKPIALVSYSNDHGQTWASTAESNLPMAASKPCAGVLSTGQRYLIGSCTADGKNRRSPLTIAVSKRGENSFSKLFVIRHAEFADGPGESDSDAALSYPYATEHQGKLHVAYSNNGKRRGNNNSAELAVIPIEKLAVE